MLLERKTCLDDRRMSRKIFLACGVVALLSVSAVNTLSPGVAVEALPEKVEFNRDIRPILSDHCFTCHGPDKGKRKADLRLDTEEGAFADLDDCKVITPGSLAKSAVYQRITAENEKKRMPPANSARKLTDRQIQLL